MTEMILYQDEECIRPFIIESFGKVDAGDSKILEGWLKNEIELDIEQIYYESPDNELYVENLPEELSSGKVKKVNIVFKPSENRDKGLNSFITIKGKKIIPAE